MNKTGINWCDLTWNPVTGCNKIAQGCKFCYAETIANRFWGDRKFTDIEFHENRLQAKELKSKKSKRIFVNSMSDLFHEKLQPEQVQKVLDVIRNTPQHTFLVLTKRIKNISYFQFKDIPNLWLGYSASTQKDLDDGIDYLLASDAKIKWLSLEPLIELVKPAIVDWIVVGCESGNNRRECNNNWVEYIKTDAKMLGIPIWVKQLQIDGIVVDDVEKFPSSLQFRELPK